MTLVMKFKRLVECNICETELTEIGLKHSFNFYTITLTDVTSIQLLNGILNIKTSAGYCEVYLDELIDFFTYETNYSSRKNLNR